MNVLLGLLLAACVTRLWLMPLPSSFWLDELVTSFVVKYPAHPSFAIAPQVPESLYYWLPRAMQALFGFSEVAYRLPSVIAMGIALDAAERAGEPYDGAVALGCVIRGETYHFEIVAGESSRALIGLAVARGLALGNGILTVETEAQAEARADPARGDKGGDAARAALALAALKRELAAP